MILCCSSKLEYFAVFQRVHDATQQVSVQKGLSEPRLRDFYGREQRCRQVVTPGMCARSDAHRLRAEVCRLARLQKVNTTLGNLKNGSRGIYHPIRHKHVPRYLAVFQYRYNRHY